MDWLIVSKHKKGMIYYNRLLTIIMILKINNYNKHSNKKLMDIWDKIKSWMILKLINNNMKNNKVCQHQ